MQHNCFSGICACSFILILSLLANQITMSSTEAKQKEISKLSIQTFKHDTLRPAIKVTSIVTAVLTILTIFNYEAPMESPSILFSVFLTVSIGALFSEFVTELLCAQSIRKNDTYEQFSRTLDVKDLIDTFMYFISSILYFNNFYAKNGTELYPVLLQLCFGNWLISRQFCARTSNKFIGESDADEMTNLL